MCACTCAEYQLQIAAILEHLKIHLTARLDKRSQRERERERRGGTVKTGIVEIVGKFKKFHDSCDSNTLQCLNLCIFVCGV